MLEDVGQKLLERCGVLAGVALVERGDDETARIEALPPERFFSDEPRLLEMARRWMPHLPFSDVDLLLIDEIGKNLSGSGLDVNVVGRKSSLHHAAEGRADPGPLHRGAKPHPGDARKCSRPRSGGVLPLPRASRDGLRGDASERAHGR